ncbi:MAG: NUDIX domain-containing protein [Eubacteriales bacterium]
MEELWDLYDENRHPLGKTIVRGKHMGCAAWHVVVFVATKNSEGKYLITKRAPEKTCPGMWEFTGGSAIAGETSEDAAIREALEETGIDHSLSERTFITTLKKIWDDGELGWHGDFDDIWLFKADFPIEKVKLLPGETVDAKWVSPEELIELSEKGLFAGERALTIILKVLEYKERT